MPSGSAVPIHFHVPAMPEPVRDYLLTRLAEIPQLQVSFTDSAGDSASLLGQLQQAEVLVAWRIPEPALATAQQLKLWIFPGVGVQHLIEPIRLINQERQLVLINSHANSIAVAQHSAAILLALTNRVIQHHGWMAQGRWRTGDNDGESILLQGKRIGLLGYGAVNQQLQRLLSSFGADFIGLRTHWEPANQDHALPLAACYEPEELSDFLSLSDAVVIAVPSTPLTRNMLGDEQLRLLGNNGLLINVARVDIVQEEPLYLALRDGVIAGAALDVWYDYQPKSDADGRKYPYHFPFHQLSNVVLSPHRAASPVFALERWDDIVDLVRRYALGLPLRNIVDLAKGY